MRLWNGWGDDQTTYHLPDSAQAYLTDHVGAGEATPDVTLEQVMQHVPPSRLPDHPLVIRKPFDRATHAVGQSLPDWVAVRSGDIPAFPDGVAYPTDDAQVRKLYSYAQGVGARLIPYGGGTSVVGHINPLPGDAPVLTVDLSRMHHLLDLDKTSRLASFEAGVNGPSLETQLKSRGYTLGHFPQSWELSTLGGWIATRSSGQQSFYYGRIEDLFAGGHVEAPSGAWDFPTLPASAAGPDLRQVFLGSEGRMGIITRAQVRVRPLPWREQFFGVFFPTWEQGMAAARFIAQEGIRVSMARLSTPIETETTLRLSGKDGLVKLAENGLGAIGYGPERCLMVLGITGSKQTFYHSLEDAKFAVRRFQGFFVQTAIAPAIGKIWEKSRFLSPYLRNTLWERGYAVDTFETAVPWKAVPQAIQDMQAAIHGAIQSCNERAHVFAHLSHLYSDGASIYVTYIFRRAADPGETLARWQAMKAAGSQAVLQHGGTISHQHGVGVDHAPYLLAEKGDVGMRLISSAIRCLDPQEMLNPGKLVPELYPPCPACADDEED
jgi:alkyldihydroxyacetonephosphate synthase